MRWGPWWRSQRRRTPDDAGHDRPAGGVRSRRRGGRPRRHVLRRLAHRRADRPGRRAPGQAAEVFVASRSSPRRPGSRPTSATACCGSRVQRPATPPCTTSTPARASPALTLTTDAPSFINDVVVTSDAAVLHEQPAAGALPGADLEARRGRAPRDDPARGRGRPVTSSPGSTSTGSTPRATAARCSSSTAARARSTRSIRRPAPARRSTSAAPPSRPATASCSSGAPARAAERRRDPGANQIAVVRLRDRLTGEIVDTITSPLFETATTLARSATRWSPSTPSSSRRGSTRSRGRAPAALTAVVLCHRTSPRGRVR